MKVKEDTCLLREFGQCCCVCFYHIADNSHPETDGGEFTHQRGWVCYAPDFEECVFSGWSEHGLCEMFKFIRDDYKLSETLKASLVGDENIP